jgi:type IV secretory pathway TraG/TraD family ATPase VirD4
MLETILSNTVTHLLLPGAGKEETEYYSARIGNTTIQTETRNTKGGYSLLGEQQESWTQGETGRRLMTPDELRTMPANDMLMLGSSSAPMIIKTKPYFEERRFVNLTHTSFHSVHIHQEPPSPPQTPRSSPNLPPSQQQLPPRVIESNPNAQHNQSNNQFFLQEDE